MSIEKGIGDMTNIKKKKCISIMVISFIIFIIVIFSFNNITKYCPFAIFVKASKTPLCF